MNDVKMDKLNEIFLQLKMKEILLIQNNIKPTKIIIDINTYNIICESYNFICFKGIKQTLLGYNLEIIESDNEIITFCFDY